MRRGQSSPSLLMSSNTQLSVKISSSLAGKIQGLVLFRKVSVYNICSFMELNKFFGWVKFSLQIIYNLSTRVKLLETAFNLSFGCLFCLLYPATPQVRGCQSSSKEEWMTFFFRNQKRRGGGGAVRIYGDPPCSGEMSLTLVPHFFSWESWQTRGAEESLHWKRVPCRNVDFVQTICIDHSKNTQGHGLLSVTQCETMFTNQLGECFVFGSLYQEIQWNGWCQMSFQSFHHHILPFGNYHPVLCTCGSVSVLFNCFVLFFFRFHI